MSRHIHIEIDGVVHADPDAYARAVLVWIAEAFERAIPDNDDDDARWIYDPTDLRTADAILAAHPDREDKTGTGFAAAYLIYGNAGRLHLAAQCAGGSLARLRLARPWARDGRRQQLLAVLREEVAHQLREERRVLRERGVTTCTACGTFVGDGGELDHAPIPFAMLAGAWIDGREIPLWRPPLTLATVRSTRTRSRIADPAQRASWRAFHLAHAELRLTCSACNTAAGDHGATLAKAAR